MKRILLNVLFFCTLHCVNASAHKYAVYTEPQQNARIEYGISKLQAALSSINSNVIVVHGQSKDLQANSIVIGFINDEIVQSAIKQQGFKIDEAPGKEGFIIHSSNNITVITGADASGVMYGCFELADSINLNKKLPVQLTIKDQPQMVMRGACVGLQKPYLLPGRAVYEYPLTEETFPWFYNKKLWVRYLDSLAEYRCNSLYLWNGHPFASLVKVKDYPYAVEVDEATFKKNEDMYRFLAEEADRRGIWLIQSFYNIIVSKPFAEHHHLKTQDRDRHIIPVIADYTRKSIAAFVEKYPNVGLLITLGEAMEGAGQDDIDWFTKTIIPGVKDGLKAANITTEPPIILRAHDTNAPNDINAAKNLYSNLYTMAKYNGEALTTYQPRVSWADLHRTLSRLGTVQIENVHILANLEPFRYAADDFIQKCVQAMHTVYEANGLHLYPQASYWDWPYTADSASTPLLQIERDWLWYKEWSRYAWNCNRDRAGEVNYWSNQIALQFNCNKDDAKNILLAYEAAGEIAPKLLRRFGITDGNRQTLTLGMQMTQLVNPERYGLFKLLYESEAPEGEPLAEYAQKEWEHQLHIGETPVNVINDVKKAGDEAVAFINKINTVPLNNDEFKRIKNDMYCYQALAYHYAYKAQAALYVLKYKYSNNTQDLDSALLPLQKSVEWYKTLTRLTNTTYRYANSMQTAQRKIPFRGVDATFIKWNEVLPAFEKELQVFTHKLDSLKHPSAKENTGVTYLQPADVTIKNDNIISYPLTRNAQPFINNSTAVINIAPELKNIKAIKIDTAFQNNNETLLRFHNDKPVKFLVGYFVSDDKTFLKAPELETNANANNHGEADVAIANALVIENMPAVNIHTYLFNAGDNELLLPKGKVLLLGFIDAAELVKPFDAGLTPSGELKNVDWLFEN
ncbi:alpha-d-galacturonidase [Parafilimonas terrae]|uniref:Glycosyl hydrolase family 67 N-terminus n=1 Tax=Parafilimonas terrae TaxID=1465490 RepID=A0A1I5TND2_9BACT|nr:alpha-glucuronidase family glycosyl hydrolase [Parafilimonas terrae]SFP84488.1 Glycosyl hydrolase family 67 N-terminus [Parafilimonas terrae]